MGNTAGAHAPSKKEVVAFARSNGVEFSKEYIAHSTGQLGGLCVQVKEELWPHANALDVGPFWSFCRGLYTFAYGEEAPEWLQIAVATAQLKEMGHEEKVPFMKIWSDPQIYCFDSNGEIVRFLHDENEFEPVDKSFFALLEFELMELAERKRMKLSQMGKEI